MNNAKKTILGLILLSLMAFIMASCLQAVTDESGRTYYVLSFFSYPMIYLTQNGSYNFSDVTSPVTGTDVSNATVTVSNETTGVSTVAAWTAAVPPWHVHGYYTPGIFSHTSGESVSVNIKVGGETLTGAPTVTPNPTYSNLSPSSGASATLPFTVSWKVTQGTYAATHTWLSISSSTTEAKHNYQVIVPVNETSATITSDILAPDRYYIYVFGVNAMSFTGARSGSIGYVDGGGISAYSINVSVEAQ